MFSGSSGIFQIFPQEISFPPSVAFFQFLSFGLNKGINCEGSKSLFTRISFTLLIEPSSVITPSKLTFPRESPNIVSFVLVVIEIFGGFASVTFMYRFTISDG